MIGLNKHKQILRARLKICWIQMSENFVVLLMEVEMLVSNLMEWGGKDYPRTLKWMCPYFNIWNWIWISIFEFSFYLYLVRFLDWVCSDYGEPRFQSPNLFVTCISHGSETEFVVFKACLDFNFQIIRVFLKFFLNR